MGCCAVILTRKSAQNIAANGTVGQGAADFLDRSDKGFCGIAPVHPGQNPVITALQRNVQMGHKVGVAGHYVKKSLINFRGFNRTEAYAYAGKIPAQSFKQRVNTLTFIKIQPIFANIYSRNDYFKVALLSKNTHLFKDLFKGKAAAASPCVGNNTIGTKIIAAILNAHVCSCPSAESLHRQRADLFFCTDSACEHDHVGLFIGQGCFNQKMLIPVSDNGQWIINNNVEEFFRRHLGVTAGNNKPGLRVFSHYFADQLA